jgi:hypothetical protein
MRITTLALSLVVACHAAQPRPSQPPEQRAAGAIVAWGNALREGNVQGVEDGAGRFAILYVGAKAAASHVDGGAEAVERTVVGNLFLFALQSLWPGIFGAPYQTWFAVIPTGPLGPALVEAGLATQAKPGDPAFAWVPVPYDQTLGRIERAIEDHRARLLEKEAWTCRFERIEHTVLPTEPTLQRAAQISTNLFAGWLRDIEAVWIVRARCASGPALFAITAYRDKALILFAGI